jgi:tetratricopeptide (TPR) repeat protein
VDPITPTCKIIALAALLFVAPAFAKPEPESALGSYVKARLAGAAGQGDFATAAYEAALTADPASKAVAGRAYRQALEAGNRPLALRAARTLDTAQALPPDARILFVVESIAKADWRGAAAQIDKIEEAGTFAFLAPVLRSWVSYGSRLGDPVGTLSTRSSDGFSVAYAQEHRGLMMLALKQSSEGASVIREAANGERQGIVLRLAAAARLLELKDRAGALAMVEGSEISLVLARKKIENGEGLTGSISKPNSGVAALLARVTNDLLRDNASQVALTLARLATFADPALPQAQLALARALGATGQYDAALGGLDRISRQSVYLPIANDLRFGFLGESGRFDAALDMARASAASPSASTTEQVRLGEALSRAGKAGEAAAVYRQAIETMAGPDRNRPVAWALWLLLGRAYDEAGDWASAKPALRRAVELAPSETSALNQLGYGMLVNGEDVAEATRLISLASQLRPTDPAISDSLGWALFKGGKASDAIPILERAVASEPTIAEIGEHLGDVYWSVGRKIDARYAWRAALVQSDEAGTKRIAAKIDFGPKDLPARK